MELNNLRPMLPHALDQMNRINDNYLVSNILIIYFVQFEIRKQTC